MPVSKRGFDTKKRPEGSPQASQSTEFRVRRRSTMTSMKLWNRHREIITMTPRN
jgi:hypothetical protein